MYKRYCVLIFLVVIFWSCSSSTQEDSGQTSKPSKYHLEVNGEVNYDGEVSKYLVQKSENTVLLKTGMYLSFDELGNLGVLSVNLQVPFTDTYRRFYTPTNFSSHYFNFDLNFFDEETKRAKGTFSGYLYANPLDLNSESKFVNGNFDLAYNEIVPAITGVKNEAKINGNYWRRTNKYMTKGGIGNNDITQHDFRDDEYQIMLNYNLLSIGVGTFNYTNNSGSNNVRIAKYDVATNSYIYYNCTGVMNITKKVVYASNPNFVLYGNYSFTAVNPNDSSDVIQVTDGVFKTVYVYF